MKVVRRFGLASCLWAIGLTAQGGELIHSYQLARSNDPGFQAAIAERKANLIQSQVARAALFPELRASMQQIETETTPRRTYQLTQPLLAADRIATFLEGTPREGIAEYTYQQREGELLQRYYRAVSELVRIRESIALNTAKMDAFSQQVVSAKRSFELGAGTVTDLRDAEVRLAQAKSNDLQLKARQAAAERQFSMIVGELPPPEAFHLKPEMGPIPLLAVDDYLESAGSGNPQLVVARQNQRIAELGELRAKMAYLPSVSAVATQTEISGRQNNYVGVALTYPLQAGSVLQVRSAAANAEKAKEQARDSEEKVRLEVQRLHDLVKAASAEIDMRLAAVNAATLSVEANEKSFRGGVRSKVDVLNSIQTLFQTKEEYVNAVVQLGENYLNLQLQAAIPALDALRQVESALF